MNISNKTLSSWLLILGAILTLVIWVGLEPAIVGDYTSPQEFLGMMGEAGDVGALLGLLGGVFFLAQIVGTVMFARQLSEGDSGAAFGNIAAILGIVLGAAIIGTNDLGLSALAAGSAGDAASAMVGAQVSYYSGASFGMLFGLTYLCLSLPMIAQASDMFQKVLGYLLGLLTLVMIISTLAGVDLGTSVIGIIVWLGLVLVLVLTGVANLRSSE
ncbi:MAG: hypothetical protein CMD88_05825 [Gammaproteobacteria bacterium]|nr:hypothetical protein [Gammaproteobacteria bacterium]